MTFSLEDNSMFTPFFWIKDTGKLLGNSLTNILFTNFSKFFHRGTLPESAIRTTPR